MHHSACTLPQISSFNSNLGLFVSDNLIFLQLQDDGSLLKYDRTVDVYVFNAGTKEANCVTNYSKNLNLFEFAFSTFMLSATYIYMDLK